MPTRVCAGTACRTTVPVWAPFCRDHMRPASAVDADPMPDTVRTIIRTLTTR